MTDHEKLNTVPDQLQIQTIQIFENLGLDLGANYDGGNGHSNTSGRRAYFDNGEGYRISVHEDTEWFEPNQFQVWIEDDDGEAISLSRYNLTTSRVIVETIVPSTQGLSEEELAETLLDRLQASVVDREDVPMSATDEHILSVLLAELEVITSPQRFSIEESHYAPSFVRAELVEHSREVLLGDFALHVPEDTSKPRNPVDEK